MSSASVFPHFDPFADLNGDVDEKGSSLSLPYCDACHKAHLVSEPSISLVDCCCSTLSQSCLASYINQYVAACKSVSSIPCPQPSCGKELTTAMIQSILPPADFEAYLHATLVAFIEQDQHSFICPNDACKSVISIAPFNPPVIPDVIPEKDEDGRTLSAEAWLHFCEYRVRCRECNLIFCASCKTTPYHKGYTCSAYKDYQSARHCRFCTQRLDGGNQYRHPSSSIALKDVCTEEECVKKAEQSCERMLPCGCPCQGIKGEVACLPCLKHDLEIAEEFCPVCYVEELSAAPCIKMTGPCLHVVHYQCALTKITSKWPGARISFEFRTCPVCKQNMAHPALETVLAPVIAMESGIIEKALQRLKYEARESDPAITQKGGEFFQNAVGFAMKNYLFYQCFKCQRPYFAGGYQCVDASVQGFDPSELICPSCQPSSVEDCIAEGTLVALADGTSLPIESVRVGMKVLARHAAEHEEESDGLTPLAVTAVLDRGRQPCVKLLFSDGRTLVCTEQHRLLSPDGRWIAAADLLVGQSKVAVAMNSRRFFTAPQSKQRFNSKRQYRDTTADVTSSPSSSSSTDNPLPRRLDLIHLTYDDDCKDDYVSTEEDEKDADDSSHDDDSEGDDEKANKVNYSIPNDSGVLPLIRVKLLGRRFVGEQHVYDLTVPSPQGDDSCSFTANGIVVHNCKVHGKDWLAYKCRYCCSFANWYCWGNTHFCDKCHKSGVWQQLTVFRSGKNKKKLWEYENCASLQPQVDAIGKDNSMSEEQKNNALGKLLSAPKACVLGVRHPPTGIEFGLGCSMCEDSQSSSEKLKENEAAVKAKLAVVKEGLGKQPRTFVYRHDLDENGVMYYLGTCGRTQAYQNPAEAGFVRVISSGLMGDSAPLSAAVGRELVRCVTTPVKNSWFVFELVDLQLALTHYTLRHYNSWDTECLRHWQLEGSNESVQGPWEVIIQHTNDESLRKKGATHTWQVPNTGKRYRLFRLFQSGRNSNKNYYLPCSGLEFYGTLFVNEGAEAVGSPASKAASPRSAKPSITPPPIPPPRPTLSPPSAVGAVSGPRVFTYRGDMDQNGICYWLGTRCGTVPSYNNPADIGLVRVRCSELAKDGAPINAVVGRDVVRVVSVPKPGQWFVIDFTPSGYRIRPSAYTLRHYFSWDLEALRNWKLEGSVNGNDWFVLSVHADDQALNGKGSLHTWQLGAQQGQFTQFRIWQTGLNSNNHHYLALSGFEVYGEVYPNSPPLATPFDAVRSAHAISSPVVAAGVYPQYSQQPYPVQIPLLPPPPSSRPNGPPPVPLVANGHMPRPPPIPAASPADVSPHSHPTASVSSPPPIIPFRYQHDFDTNGLFYYLGTRGRTAPWSNPCNQRLLNITCSALATNPPSAPCSALVNRELVRCVSQAKPDMWFTIGLVNVSFHCTHYTLQHYASFDVEALRNWRFEASQDGNNWDVLREHINDQALQKAGQTHTWPVIDTPQTVGKCYRMFRIWQTGLNSNNNHYLALSGVELYGWMPLPGAANRSMPQQPPPMPPAPPRLPAGPPVGSPTLARPPSLPPTVASTPPPVNNNPFAYAMAPARPSMSPLSGPPSGPPPPPAQSRPSQSYPVQSWPPSASIPSPPLSQSAAPSPPVSNGYNPFADTPMAHPLQQQPPSSMAGGSSNPFAVPSATPASPPSSSPPPPPLLSTLSINAAAGVPPSYSSPSSRSSYQPLSTPSPRSPSLPPPFHEGMSFEYSYDFDECGLMFYLGSKQRTAPWRNPDDLGVVRVTSVPLAVSPASAPASAIVGREVVRCVTQPNRESWFCIDLLTWYCRPTHYTLRHYDSFDSEALRDWKLQGSNDGKKWSKLVSHKKDENLNGKGSSHTWEIPATKKAYRMFRILQTGKNSNGHWYCALSGFEIYGQLYTQPPKVKE